LDILVKMITAALFTIFIQNTVYERALGVNVLLYSARKKTHVLGYSFGICYITTVSSIATFFLDKLFVENEYYEMFMPLLYVAVVGVIYVITLIFFWRFFPRVFYKIKNYVHLSVFNATVLGALFLNPQLGGDLFSYIGYGIGTGLGFMLASALLFSAGKSLSCDSIPPSFRGMPVMMVYIGILSLALSAFIGYSTAA
jgi:electron transport complex protein RnfA